MLDELGNETFASRGVTTLHLGRAFHLWSIHARQTT
jgi:hypothetical protein